MVDSDDGEDLESRPPTLEDLLSLCTALNDSGARYIVVGGMAVIQHGFVRATEDIDLLVDTSADNFARLQQALSVLPDRAILEVAPSDLDEYIVVRVADEIVVDLMKAACGVEYATAVDDIELVEIEGVLIPFANVDLLLRMKQTVRAKDELDRMFLERRKAELERDD